MTQDTAHTPAKSEATSPPLPARAPKINTLSPSVLNPSIFFFFLRVPKENFYETVITEEIFTLRYFISNISVFFQILFFISGVGGDGDFVLGE